MVIAPKSIVTVWEEEFSKFTDFSYSLTVLKGSSEKKKGQLKGMKNRGLQIAVINYDSTSLIEKDLMQWKPDFIVADESTRIKNPNAKTSKSIHKISKTCKYRMILTGSPITQNLLDLYSQYKMLDQSIFGISFYAFKNYYAVLGDYNQPVGYRNLPELIEKTHSIAYRITKEEALDLPKTIDETHGIVLEGKTQKLSGGRLPFEVPGDNGESEAAKEIEGFILYHHALNSYYKDKYTGGSNLPPEKNILCA